MAVLRTHATLSGPSSSSARAEPAKGAAYRRNGLTHLVSASKAGQDVMPYIATAGVIAWALIVANVNRPWGFRFQEKHTL